jgi:type I restriction enzyme M protein
LHIEVKSGKEPRHSCRGCLPKTYHILDSRTLASLLKTMASISMDKGGDTFGLIYEYFLGKFAMSEGQKGGEWSDMDASAGAPEG